MRIDNVKLKIGESEEKLKEIAAKKVRNFKYLRIVRKSLDARDKTNIHWVYSLEVSKEPFKQNSKTYPRVKREPDRAIVVGSGPAGLFCALRLLRGGIRPLIVERGGTVEERVIKNETFIAEKVLDENCNIQFGEGGAGTFSDGKLNTQTHDPRNQEVLQIFAEFGAPKEITYLNKPHIGSDNLRRIVANIRKYILANGGEFFFHTLFEGIKQRDGRVYAVLLRDLKTNTLFEEKASDVVLAIGHSSRDTFERLHSAGFMMQAREFAVGVRIEHLQQKINFAQYSVRHTLLPPADYKLVSHAGERTAFTFCMCPGGYVVPASSEEETVVTNGMSNYARDGVNANSALLVQVRREDFDRGNVLDGMRFQRELEKKAFFAAGSTYAAPIQRVEDFLCKRVSRSFGEVLPTYGAGTAFCDLHELFPSYISSSMQSALLDMDKRLKGFSDADALMTAPETRFSSPVRILRGEDLESVSLKGVYPCGEGCGYSGGITSSAADGMRVAECICAKYC